MLNTRRLYRRNAIPTVRGASLTLSAPAGSSARSPVVDVRFSCPDAAQADPARTIRRRQVVRRSDATQAAAPDATKGDSAYCWRFLPRRLCSHPHADGGPLPFGDSDERRFYLHGGRAQSVDHPKHKLGRDVSGAQADDPDKRLAVRIAERPKATS